MRLAKMFRNGLIKAVEDGGLDARDCDFEFNEERARISHRSSGGFFLLEGDFGHFTCTWGIGDHAPWGPLDAFNWDSAEERVKRWAGSVVADVNTPDLWAELLAAQGSTLTELVSGRAENSPFNPAEQEQLRRSIEQIRDYVMSAADLSSDQQSETNARLDYLIAATKRTGRIDWKNIAVTVLLTTAVEIGRDAAQRDAFLNFCATALADLVMRLPQLPIH